jgi:phosphoribosylformimino-5-aminoimidazole carboxamide ribotide isomerase
MEVVPVIDLKGGVVVRARSGDRAAYRPIETPLSQTSDALDVAEGLLGLYPFATLYVADLDAIEGRGDNNAVLRDLARRFPDLALWVDNGCANEVSLRSLLAVGPATCAVLGSESQRNCELVHSHSGNARVILSLDYRGERFLGPECLLHRPVTWPDRVIVMTLAAVGGGTGPDLERFAGLRQNARGHKLYLAGGLRNATDLALAKAGGAAGMLVASALHDGRLQPGEIAALGGDTVT